jgi:hypothetical protein
VKGTRISAFASINATSVALDHCMMQVCQIKLCHVGAKLLDLEAVQHSRKTHNYR